MTKPVRAAIAGLGSAVPEKVLTNFDLEKMVDTSDKWITQRTGIKQRHVVSAGESTATIASEAARKALEDAGCEGKDLDLIILATISPEMTCPSTACFVQEALEATDVPCFDISAACSGWLYGLTIGSQFIETGKYKRVLVIGAEALTRFTDFTDRTSCILFGDGAGAAVLQATEDDSRGIIHTVLHANGGGWDFIHTPAGGARKPASHETVDAREHFLRMKGRDVYKFAVEKMQWLLGNCLEETGLTVEDVDLVVPHQVNTRIIKSATSKFNFPLDKVYMNIDRLGNTSAASIPLALDEAVKAGKIQEGSNVIFVAFGAGLTWAGAVVKF
ncbi:MAG: beta-ketoacyl-ACP synthase III [Phycisphaerae bacterium]